MKGKFSRIVMALVTLSMMLSAVAVVAPVEKEASAQSGGLNSWQRHDLPTTLKWQMAPNTNIWDLTAADDGTLFALVEDTSGPVDIMEDAAVAPGPAPCTWDGRRWAVFPAWSDVALFKSTDGGVEWTLMWHVPASDSGAPVAVVPQPGYVDGDAANDVIFVATGTRYLSPNGTGYYVGGPQEGNVYRSMDGGAMFTRITPRVPAVTLVAGGTITCLDVAENTDYPSTYMAIVGISSLGAGSTPVAGYGEGVYTWNEDDNRDWRDKQVANALPPAPFPGTLPAGNGLHVVQVKFSPNYTEDGQIVAVVNDDLGFAGAPPGIYVCFYDELDGTWGGDVDSPTNVRIGSTNSRARVVSIAMGDDHSKVDNCYVFVTTGNSGSPGPLNIYDDVWRIRGLATVSGPSTATAMGLGLAGGGPAVNLNDITVQGTAASGAVYVGCEFPGSTGPGTGQAQVFKCIQPTLCSAWTPSLKPPSGAWPTFVTDMSGTLMAAGGGDGFTYGGVHKMVAGAGGRNAFNGVGLLDDIAVSEDIPGYVNNVQSLMLGTSWCLAEAVAEEVSPAYETDKLMYVSTFSQWDADNIPTGSGPQPMANLSLWRWTDGIHWERIMKEFVTLPTSLSPGADYDQFRGMTAITNLGLTTFAYPWTWWPRVSRIFSEDPNVFLLGGRGDSRSLAYEQMLWYSPDKGDTWIAVTQMPFPAGGVGLTEMGWWVHDNNTIFLSDYNGWVYRTTDRGASWSEGARTSLGQDIDCIITSPDYENDHIVIVGALSFGQDRQNEVWISQDGAIQDFENIGAEINTNPLWLGGLPPSATMVTFDKDWVNNHMIYATACGPLDRWQLVGTGSTQLTEIDSSDAGVYRTEVNLNEPSASTWEQIWDDDDFDAIAKAPQPYAGMLPGQDIFRRVIISDLQVGSDGSLYIPLAVLDYSYNVVGGMLIPEKSPSPRGAGRFTAGGVLRCLDGTQDVPEWNFIDQGLGEWDGLYLNRALAGGSNTLISLAFDWQEWRFKLAIYDDTLSTTVAASAPTAGSTGVGTLAGNKVSVTLDWADLDATVYQWQVDDDCGFVTPLVASGVTSESLVTVTGLEPGVKYCWRARALEPTLSRWSEAQSFNTVIGSELLAPQLLAPAAGETKVVKQPTFQWSAIGWADKYDIQVASDAGFAAASLVINQNLGNVQAYKATSDLANSTYYWHVKAKSDTSQTAWSATGVFTVGEGNEQWRQNIRSGDLVLDPTGASLKGILAFGHVGICYGTDYIVEAVGSGVSKTPIEEWDKKNNIYVLRVDCSDQIAATAASLALTQVGKIYQPWYKYLDKSWDMNSSMWYCSELVWAAYYNLGIDIENTPDPFAISPWEIYMSPHTQIIYHQGRDIVAPSQQIPWWFHYLAPEWVDVATTLLLYILAECPVDLVVTDPDGLTISQSSNEIPDAIYMIDDFNDDGSPDTLVGIANSKIGTYHTTIVPQAGALSNDTYTLTTYQRAGTTVVADNVTVADIPNAPYTVEYLGEVVTFSDPKLEAAIRDAISKLSGDIYQSELDELTSLDASSRNISDLTGIEYCTSLQSLWLGNNQISDIKPLIDNIGLSQGAYVDLSLNPLSNDSTTIYIPTLEGRGVTIVYEITPVAGTSGSMHWIWIGASVGAAIVLGLIFGLLIAMKRRKPALKK